MKAGWKASKLGDFALLRPKKNAVKSVLTDTDEVSFVPMDCLKVDQAAFAEHEARPLGKVYGGYTYFCDGDVLLAKITPCFENGKLGIANGLTNGVGFGSSEFFVLRPNNKLLAAYLYHFLNRQSFREWAKEQMTGAVGHKRVPKELIEFLEIPIPPLEEQQRIVAVLDEAFEGLARARAHAEANLQNARELFTANVDTLLSRVGDDWSVGPLSKLVGQVATGPFGSLLHKSDYVENETPLVNPANIVDGKIVPDMRKTVNKSALERLSSYILDADDIVIGRRGEMGRCAVVDIEQAGWLCGTGSFFIRPTSDVVPKFIAHILRSPSYVARLEAASTGATMANLSNRVLSDLEVALPKRDQQLDYLEVIESFDEAAVRLESAFTAKLQDFDHLRQSLLQKAFAGELT